MFRIVLNTNQLVGRDAFTVSPSQV